MPTVAELKAEYAELQSQLTAINTRILAIIGRNDKSYKYSNQETTHQSETHTLSELKDMKKDIKDQMQEIENSLGPKFVQLKNR